jgi:hypothetical protein
MTTRLSAELSFQLVPQKDRQRHGLYIRADREPLGTGVDDKAPCGLDI